jgi:hypothetical protein
MFSFALTLTIAVALALTGCSDDSSSPADPGGTVGELDQDLANLATASASYLGATTTSAATTAAVTSMVAAYNDMLGESGAATGALDSLLASTCPAITVDTEETGFTVVLDYGSGCMPEWSEIEIAGVVTVDAEALQPGIAYTMTWEDYQVEEVEVDGMVNATLIGNTLSWAIDGTVSDGDVSVTGDLDMSATLDANSPGTIDDDELVVTGSGTIVSGDSSVAFQIDAEDPLVLRTGCDYPVAGSVALSANLGDARVDYGDGECDSLVTIWIGPYSREIDLENVDLCTLLDC